ncbi:hypothetical protein V5F77_29070, partial [Xanthobacter sp. DSM 24535]|uniref:hypothetical protein n=1 Tax=Roseixanthobacter psychrophilus TaxID=3119917 RepID=UPI00372A4C22
KNPSLAGRYRGDHAGPGLYPVLSTAAVILHGQTLPVHGTLSVTGVAQAYADGYGDQGIAIGIVTLSCQSALGDVVQAVAQAPAFTALVSSFELDAGTPIATDTITLPGLPADDEDAP